MHFLPLMTIALALSLDAFAVSVAAGIKLGTLTLGQRFRLSFHFGLFQFLMPVLGWALGLTVRPYIEEWDHWVAFVLLVLVGGNMIRGAWGSGGDDGEAGPATDPSRGWTLILLAVATSIDALAVGLSFSLLKLSVWLPAVVIGVTCALVSLLGGWLGQRLSRASLLEKRAELIGGLALVAIGIKILFDHGVFA